MLDLDIVDAHHHLWDLSGSYPWLQGPANPDRFTGDDSAIRVNYGVPEYLADVEGLRLIGSVHVDAGAGNPLAEARWVQQVHDEMRLPTVAVAAADLAASDAAATLEELSSLPSTRGIRHILNWHPDPNYSYVDRNDLLVDETWLANFARLEGLGMSFDLQVYPHQLEQASRVAAAHPGITVVLNHTGMPTSHDADHLALWRRGIAALADQPNAYVKISGLGMTEHHWTLDSLRPFVRGAIEAFGPHRSMFASNFPVDHLYSSYGELYAAFDELTADLSLAERRDLFSGTAIRVYRLPQAELLVGRDGAS